MIASKKACLRDVCLIFSITTILAACSNELSEPYNRDIIDSKEDVERPGISSDGYSPFNEGLMDWRVADWVVTRGKAREVNTLSLDEIGVELIGTQASITRFVPPITWPRELSIRATVSDGVKLYAVLEYFVLSYDAFGDVVEPLSLINRDYSHYSSHSVLGVDLQSETRLSPAFPVEQKRIPISTDDWKQKTVTIDSWPSWHEVVHLSILKEGKGRAVVTRILIDYADLGDDDFSDWCGKDRECSVGYCERSLKALNKYSDDDDEGACVMCLEDAHCPGEGVCGLHEPGWFVSPESYWSDSPTCMPPGIHTLSDRCIGDAECFSGICCKGICSTCCVSEDCPMDQVCERAFDEFLFPFQCAPGLGVLNPGDLCFRNEDCASGICMGSGAAPIPLSTHSESGIACQIDKDLPPEEIDGVPTCWIFGVEDGRCE